MNQSKSFPFFFTLVIALVHAGCESRTVTLNLRTVENVAVSLPSLSKAKVTVGNGCLADGPTRNHYEGEFEIDSLPSSISFDLDSEIQLGGCKSLVSVYVQNHNGPITYGDYGPGIDYPITLNDENIDTDLDYPLKQY